MNERIKELATEVGISVEYLKNTKQWLLIEALTKQVVSECIQVCADRGKHHDGLYSAWAEDCSKRIEEHFGVKS
jgi:uncharacterized protein (UPF0276 family)